METLVRWIGEDDPTRLDSAAVTITDGRLSAHGAQTCAEWSLVWTLVCDDDWITRRMRVTAMGPGWSRALDLIHDDGWHATVSANGGVWRPAQDFDADALTEALDCDLGLCPLTNTMPIRRLDLLGGDRPETLLTMAWIEVPSLRVIATPQRYSSVGGAVRYESERRDFHSFLTVDEDGIVIDYPHLARRI